MSVDSDLSLWILTLPAVAYPDQPLNAWRTPYAWEGTSGWTPWENCKRMVVSATDQAQARSIAAQHDCDIWLDPIYAVCVPLEAIEPGVILAERGGAENE